MNAYSNKRRSHIHFIRQYYSVSGEYTGTRIVIFIKGKKKYIYDIDNFKKHNYENPKSKRPRISTWQVVPSSIEDIIIKEMINFNEEKDLKMYHTLYESSDLDIRDYYLKVFKKENIPPLKIYME